MTEPKKDTQTDIDLASTKLDDARVPGAVVECDAEEAERMGAFAEDALSEDDAADSQIDDESE